MITTPTRYVRTDMEAEYYRQEVRRYIVGVAFLALMASNVVLACSLITARHNERKAAGEISGR
mgnify:CR=1 FL=1